jgi:hypothetical protein
MNEEDGSHYHRKLKGNVADSTEAKHPFRIRRCVNPQVT